MKLFINAGGKGTRLYPLTKNIPKGMITLAGKPILHHIIDWGKKNEINEIVIMSGYLADNITNYFKDGKEFGVKITHSIEQKPLGTGGAIKFAEKHINDTFAYINGDQICTINLKKMLAFHREHNAMITAFTEDKNISEADTLEVDTEGKVTDFITKFDPSIRGRLVNRGLCIIEPKILELMDKEEFNFENDMYPKIIKRGWKLMAYTSGEDMINIESLEQLKQCEKYLLRKIK